MKQCGTLLDKAEQKVTKLISSATMEEIPFDPEEP